MNRITASFFMALLPFTNAFTQTLKQQKTEKMKQALVIVDIQNDYFPGGRMELAGAEEAADKANQIQLYCRNKGIPVIHVQHIAATPDAGFFLPGTAGAAIHKKVLPAAGEPVIVKHYPNSFRETELLAYLREQDVTHLVVAGMMTHVCIDATVKAAKDYGFECTVIADACATKDLDILGNKVTAQHVQHALLGALAFYYAEIKTAAAFLAQ